MPDPNETLAKVKSLMREGKVQAADDLIRDHFRASVAEGGPGAPMPAEAAPVRPPLAVVHDIVSELVALLGNKQSLLDLLTELRAVL